MRRSHAIVIAALSALAGSCASAAAQTAAANTFTYQGRLTANGSPLNDSVAVSWKIFTQATGGTPVALGNATVSVTDGLLQFDLPLGAAGDSQFLGDERWLELTIDPANGPAEILTPRQPLRPAPYALFALNNAFKLDPSGNGIFSGLGRVGIGNNAPVAYVDIDGRTVGDVLYLRSNNTNYTLISLVNSAAGGHSWDLISTGPGYPTGAGDLVFRDVSLAQDRMIFGNDASIALQGSNLVASPALFSAVADNIAFGSLTSNNPSNFSRVLSVTGKNAGANAGSVALTLNNPVSGATWSIGLTTANTITFDVQGTAANVVSVPVLQVRGGSDIAEPYDIAPSAGVNPAPGMVVCIDAAHVGKMRLCDSAYDRAAAGIISGANGVNPGLTLTQSGTIADGEFPVASVGRVWCYVDADSGAIQPGDLLTTSPTPGHAMKADPVRGAGCIIGKAMSPLPAGKGLVLVLVGLR